jgi:hypothetical protein
VCRVLIWARCLSLGHRAVVAPWYSVTIGLRHPQGRAVTHAIALMSVVSVYLSTHLSHISIYARDCLDVCGLCVARAVCGECLFSRRHWGPAPYVRGCHSLISVYVSVYSSVTYLHLSICLFICLPVCLYFCRTGPVRRWAGQEK